MAHKLATLLVILATQCSNVASDETITINGDTPWVVAGGDAVIGDGAEGSAYNLALRDLQRDWYKVFGHPPALVTFPPNENIVGPLIYMGTVGNNVANGINVSFDLSGCNLESGVESHCIMASPQNQSIVVTGNGTRGAIFALYTFSEQILGVDPWYRFTGIQPTYTPSMSLSSSLKITVAAPKFEFRGFFTNDEDMLGYFRSDPLGEAVFDTYTWDAIFETLLRNKGNMIIPGTSPNPDEKSLKLAFKRGIVVSQSHFEILGFGAREWLDAHPAPRSTYNWTAHPDLLAHVWEAAVDAQSDKEVIFTVGLRGLWDYEYCGRDTTPAECGAIISSAISNQTSWIKEKYAGNPWPTRIITYLWDEGLSLFKQGFIKVPEGVKVIFTDEGKGYIGGLDDLKYAHGLYYHTAMLDGSSNQISEMIPPSRIFAQLAAFIKNCSDTYYFVDNVSDLFPVLLSTEAAMKFAWDPTPYLSNDTNATQLAFFLQWSKRQFGDKAADDIAQVYNMYFNIPSIAKGNSDEHIGATLSHVADPATSDIQKTGKVSNTSFIGANTTLVENVDTVAASNKTLQKALAILGSGNIPDTRVQFFKTHVVYQASLQYYGYLAIQELALSIMAAYNNNMQQAQTHAAATIAALDNLFAAQREAEGNGEWKGLFMGDRLYYSCLQSRRRQVLSYVTALKNRTAMVADSGRGYYSFYDYQDAALDNYPLFYPSTKYKANDFVMMNCTKTEQTGSSCSTGPYGGQFSQQASVGMFSTRCRTHDVLLPLSQCSSSIVVHYTLDGSSPALSSAVYTSPVIITETTTIRASVAVNGTLHALIHNATFTKM
eukprot:m.40100 g.40100  ORF g.40100 m.40100 type:complete len:827 (+) comp9627_c0_seq1:100-2580(+)